MTPKQIKDKRIARGKVKQDDEHVKNIRAALDLWDKPILTFHNQLHHLQGRMIAQAEQHATQQRLAAQSNVFGTQMGGTQGFQGVTALGNPFLGQPGYSDFINRQTNVKPGGIIIVKDGPSVPESIQRSKGSTRHYYKDSPGKPKPGFFSNLYFMLAMFIYKRWFK